MCIETVTLAPHVDDTAFTTLPTHQDDHQQRQSQTQGEYTWHCVQAPSGSYQDRFGLAVPYGVACCCLGHSKDWPFKRHRELEQA